MATKNGTKITHLKKTDKHILGWVALSYLEPSRSSLLRFSRIFVAGDLIPPSTTRRYAVWRWSFWIVLLAGRNWFNSSAIRKSEVLKEEIMPRFISLWPV